MERGRAERAAFLGPEQKAWAMSGMTLRVAHLYPRLMNIYGDRGNIMCLRRRCEARGIEFEVMVLGMGERLDPSGVDLIFAGGAQDREQRNVVDDLLATKADAVREAVEAGVVLLAVCGAYQLFGRFYRESTGVELQGVGIFDLHTEHPGETATGLIGTLGGAGVRAGGGRRDGAGARGGVPLQGAGTIVGFENHGGRTYLGPGARPLARVRTGHGNNGQDRTEGAVYGNAYGTYIHGSLLPKNPAFADHLIALALGRRHGEVELAAIDDRAEARAHAGALKLPA